VSQSAQEIITGFIDRVILALVDGKLDVLAMPSPNPHHFGAPMSFTLTFEGHQVAVYDHGLLTVRGQELEKDEWVVQLRRRLWDACAERNIFQEADRDAAERAEKEAAEAKVRHARYEALAVKLAPKTE